MGDDEGPLLLRLMDLGGERSGFGGGMKDGDARWVSIVNSGYEDRFGGYERCGSSLVEWMMKGNERSGFIGLGVEWSCRW